jgi:hypothetical protein
VGGWLEKCPQYRERRVQKLEGPQVSRASKTDVISLRTVGTEDGVDATDGPNGSTRDGFK